MRQKENAPTAQGNESAIKNSANSTGSTIKLTPRQHLDDVRVKRDGELDDIPQPQEIEEAVENYTLHIG